MSLSILPVELVSNILEYTDYRTVIACRKSCRRLKDIVDASSALIYIIELAAAGMCDGAPNGVGQTERLRRLWSSQSRWKCPPSPTWSQPDNFPYSQRILAYPLAASGNLVIFHDSHRGLGKLLLLRFPSYLRGIPGRQWYLDLKSKNHIERICADDSQDLLIFFSPPYIYIRTLSTGMVHPLTNTLGYIDSGMPYFNQHFCSYIHNDLIALVWIRRDPHMVVFNWKTGEQILKIASLPLSPCPGHFSGCAFLDGSNVIFPYCTDDDERVTRLRVVTLPSIANRWSMLHVPHDTFLSYIAAHPAEPDTVVVPWVEWGPGNSHLLDASNALPDTYSGEVTCGMYALTELPMIRSPGERKTLRVKDYHPQRVARILSEQDLRLPGTVNTNTREGPDHFDIETGQRSRSSTSAHAGIPYATMDIPFPDEIQSDCVGIVGEDVVVVLEVDEGHIKRGCEKAWTRPDSTIAMETEGRKVAMITLVSS
ncbi:hypothetical protein BJV78DRAFT_1155130 [Lactifluus subvellereus]|nr:hypothetical protein BJV78DRAFT_1155130 [Lactifluus subvellereus]